jgi:hypothetical protein
VDLRAVLFAVGVSLGRPALRLIDFAGDEIFAWGD